VVASRRQRLGSTRRDPVSIPFIAGQWSLLAETLGMIINADKFQSPSLRGSGRFRARAQERAKKEIEFQSPSLRGSGRFHGGRRRHRRARGVSIPFIAGQWSLRRSRGFGPTLRSWFQSPSLRGSGRFYASSGATPSS